MNTQESNFHDDSRNGNRDSAALRTIVQVKEADGEAWKEVTIVNTVSRNGAGFTLKRKCHVGRLVMLVMPMPENLRVYDHSEKLYPIVGLVQYCNEVTVDDETVFQVGVAFIGKQIPDSYKTNPEQSFRMSGISEDGLWSITEAGTQYKARKDQRFWVPVDVTISLIKSKNKDASKESTVTQNVSASGASMPCSLDAKVGDRVKFASKEHDFYALATIRNIKESSDGSRTMHIEFVDDKYPMDKILFAHKYAPPPQVAELETFAA